MLLVLHQNMLLGGAAPSIYETIPYLIGAEEYQARQMLDSIYMEVVVVGTTGTVTAQDVEAFTQVPRGTTVTITLGGAINVPRGRRFRRPRYNTY